MRRAPLEEYRNGLVENHAIPILARMHCQDDVFGGHRKNRQLEGGSELVGTAGQSSVPERSPRSKGAGHIGIKSGSKNSRTGGYMRRRLGCSRC
jgi:hypothetical protein